MQLLPAIDLRNGRVVRLRQGRADDETVYSDDPAAMARRWADAGAQWLHLVDLDGAFDGQSGNLEAIRSIIAAVDIPCELGGGMRRLENAAEALSIGVQRVIFGTVAITEPDVVAHAVERFGAERVAVGLDARDGRVAVRGWTETSSVSATDLALQMKAMGVRRVIYTDILRDGMFTGPNVEATAALARSTGLKVIASGGVSTVEDIENIVGRQADGIEGIIIGKALYDGNLTLRDALNAAQSEQQ